MAIKKQEFYEGAALHMLARVGEITGITYRPPFFTLNGSVLVLLKYSAKGRSPWGFTFTPLEQELLRDGARENTAYIGLVCGSDGVAALTYTMYASIAVPRKTSIHISCYRDHNKHYEVGGPDGMLAKRVAPSNWQRILRVVGDQ